MIAKRFWTPQCIGCTRYHIGKETCDAYPEGVPHEIYWDEVNHKKPYKGDHGLMYVEKKYSGRKAKDYAPTDKGAPFEEVRYTGDEDVGARSRSIIEGK